MEINSNRYNNLYFQARCRIDRRDIDTLLKESLPICSGTGMSSTAGTSYASGLGTLLDNMTSLPEGGTRSFAETILNFLGFGVDKVIPALRGHSYMANSAEFQLGSSATLSGTGLNLKGYDIVSTSVDKIKKKIPS